MDLSSPLFWVAIVVVAIVAVVFADDVKDFLAWAIDRLVTLVVMGCVVFVVGFVIIKLTN